MHDEIAAQNSTPISQETNEEGMPSPTSNDLKTALVGLPRANKESEKLLVAFVKDKLVQVRVLLNNLAASGIEPQGLTGQNTKQDVEKKT